MKKPEIGEIYKWLSNNEYYSFTVIELYDDTCKVEYINEYPFNKIGYFHYNTINNNCIKLFIIKQKSRFEQIIEKTI